VRLAALDHGHEPEVKAMMAQIQEREGYVSDIGKALRYRPELFGGPFGEFLQQLMRGEDSEWTEGERELFATFVSAQNQCPF